jgi:hypothetical protein
LPTSGKVAAVKLKAVPINRSGGIVAVTDIVDVDILTLSSLQIAMLRLRSEILEKVITEPPEVRLQVKVIAVELTI